MNDNNFEQAKADVPADVQVVDHASLAVAEGAKKRVEARYIMALKRPRNRDRSWQNILQACKRPKFAKDAIYKVRVGSEFNERTKRWEPVYHEDLSIRAAEEIIKQWENILVETLITYDDRRIRKVLLEATDLETNTTYMKEFIVEKTVERKKAEGRKVIEKRLNSEGTEVYIVEAYDFEVTKKQDATLSKILRNEGLRLIPSDVKEDAKEELFNTRKKEIKENPDEEKKKILKAFADLDIMADDLELYIGHSTARVCPEELEDLRKVYQAVKDGESSWESFVEGKTRLATKDNGDGEQKKKGNDLNGRMKYRAEKMKSAGSGETVAEEIQKICDTLGITANDLETIREREGFDELIGEEGIIKTLEFLQARPSLGQIKTVQMVQKKLDWKDEKVLETANEKTGKANSHLWEFKREEMQEVINFMIKKSKKKK